MKILAIDTATENCSAALLVDGNVRAHEVEIDRGHAERILAMVDNLLAEGHLSLSDLNAIAFGRGPGSFTGVRLAATVTQGLAFGAGLGVVPVSDLRAVAQRVFGGLPTADPDPSSARVVVCNDARMGEVYWACFERGDDGLARLEGEERVSKPSEVRLPQSWTTATAAGRGFVAYAAALGGVAPTSSTIQFLPRATEVALLAVPVVAAGRLLPPEAAIPTYLRDNVAQVAQAPKPAR